MGDRGTADEAAEEYGEADPQDAPEHGAQADLWCLGGVQDRNEEHSDGDGRGDRDVARWQGKEEDKGEECAGAQCGSDIDVGSLQAQAGVQGLGCGSTRASAHRGSMPRR